MSRRLVRLTLVLAVVLLTVGCGASGDQDDTGAAAEVAYGYERDTTPALDALARSGVRFEHVLAASNWTRPSVATFFTGLSLSQHLVPGIETPVEKRRELVAMLERYATFASAVDREIVEMGPEEIERLRALGYIR